LQWRREALDLPAVLNAAVNEGHIRLIVAGLGLLDKTLEDNTSPFYRLFSRVVLGPFDARETEQMIVTPMLQMGLTFESQSNVVARIRSETGGNPNLLQFFCYYLVRGEDASVRNSITLDAVSRLARGGQFKTEFYNDFRDNVIREDKLLVYALLLDFPDDRTTYTQEEMYGALRRQGVRRSTEDVDRCCDRLCAAGFFTREGPRYQFALPPLPRFLRANYNLAHLFSVDKKDVEDGAK